MSDRGFPDLEGNILMVAGEPSGDRHAADLAGALGSRLPRVELWGMGGAHMARAKVSLCVDMAAVSVVGIVEVLSHLGAVFRARRILLREVDRRRPILGILVDYPDFNLWLARALKRRNIPIFYYICPQVWAWRRGRLRRMARLLDRVGAILPFEEDMLRGAGIPAEFVGHPLREQVTAEESPEEARQGLGLEPHAAVLGLLPGSRPGEVGNLLPVLLSAARLAKQVVPEIQPVVALSPLVPVEAVRGCVGGGESGVRVVVGEAHRVLRSSRVAVVASGTATLEAAILGTPMVVVYRASWISYWLGRLLIRVKHIALVNILAGRAVVPELLQGALTPVALRDRILGLWLDENRMMGMREDLRSVAHSLGERRASQNGARMVVEMIRARQAGGADLDPGSESAAAAAHSVAPPPYAGRAGGPEARPER